MKTALKILVGIFAAFGALVALVLGAIVLNRTLPNTSTAASTQSHARVFGKPVTVCVYEYNAGTKCGTLRTGMTQGEVTAQIGDHLHGDGMIVSRTLGDHTEETWRYFGPVEHQNYVVLGFDNEVLSVIVQ